MRQRLGPGFHSFTKSGVLFQRARMADGRCLKRESDHGRQAKPVTIVAASRGKKNAHRRWSKMPFVPEQGPGLDKLDTPRCPKFSSVCGDKGGDGGLTFRGSGEGPGRLR
jgi:hypothetical protein